VDDEVDLAHTFRELLIDSGFRDVEVAYDGQQAIEKFSAQNRYSIVVSDVRMPRVNGLKLAEHLHQNFPETVVLLVSGFSDISADKAHALGVRHVMTKPVEIDEFLALIKKYAP
jgi:YesN/AraC family two-component response regulator